jgi:dTDP-4-amino-4,6-dideoxygalactose transaminase
LIRKQAKKSKWLIAMINMNDFKREYVGINKKIMPTIRRILKSGWYMLGEEESKFEQEFSNTTS